MKGWTLETEEVEEIGTVEDAGSDDEPEIDDTPLKAPFPYFGGKRSVAADVWKYLGSDIKHYVEPFCGSLAVMLAAPRKPRLEVVGDGSFYVANFWRAVKHQPAEVARWADYPVSHVDLSARHAWLTKPERVRCLSADLLDPEHPGCAQAAGWWVWGQCAWIGSGWCEKEVKAQISSQIPHIITAGKGIQGIIDGDRREHIERWFTRLARRLQDVRVIHGDWRRCLNTNYGGDGEKVGIFFDPPYLGYERLYREQKPVATPVAEWCAERPQMRIVLCGHVGDYDDVLRGWEVVRWSRGKMTYNGGGTTDKEAMYLSPACLHAK